MYKSVRFCPRCHEAMPAENPFETVQKCSLCGAYSTIPNTKAEKANDMQVVKAMIAMTLLIGLVFAHINTWGKYSFAIVPVKVSQYIGIMNTADYEELADICMEVKLYSCVTDAYMERLNLDESNLQYNLDYANILRRTGYNEEAIVIYTTYFDLGGEDLDAAFNYAKALEEAGDYDNSAKYHEFVLKAKPRVFQITVSHSYGELLIKKGDLAKAEKFIKKVRRSGTNSPLFMDKELKEIRNTSLVAKK